MIEINSLTIEVSKGDTAAFTITFTGTDAPSDGTPVLVSIKRTKTSIEPVWAKTYTVSDSQVEVSMLVDDTNIPFGQYWWDVRILYEDGTVFTPMKPAPFKILEVVGNVR